MGTSTNQRSPSNIPSWRIFQQALGSANTAVDRQVAELWRSATADQNGRFVKELTSEAIAFAIVLSSEARDPVAAASTFNEALNERQECGIVFDLARRALLRSVDQKKGVSGFAQELFVEAANYYVSRDIPSYVAAKGRIATTTDSVKLKDEIGGLTRRAVEPIANEVARTVEKSKSLNAETWEGFVRTALNELTKRRPK